MNVTVAGELSAGSYRTSERADVIVGRNNTGQANRRALVWGHHAGGTFNSLIWDQARIMSEAGYPFVTADIGNLTSYPNGTFGNADSLTAMDSLWTWLKDTTKVGVKTDKLLLHGLSMSAQTFLAWAIAGTNASLIQAMVLEVGALDVDDAYQNNIGGLQSSIGTAYGVTYPTALPGLATHSPWAFSNTDKAKLTFPIRMYASDDDIYTTTAEAQTWAASVNTQTGLNNVSVVSMGALGHGSNLDYRTALAFFDANGGRS